MNEKNPGQDPRDAPGIAAHSPSPLRECITDALRYWEIRRVLYIAILAAIVLSHFIAGWPRSRHFLTFDGALSLFALAVLANVAYSTVYIADVFIQMSGFRASRAHWRWIFIAVGFSFAAILTHFFSMGIVSGGGSTGGS